MFGDLNTETVFSADGKHALHLSGPTREPWPASTITAPVFIIKRPDANPDAHPHANPDAHPHANPDAGADRQKPPAITGLKAAPLQGNKLRADLSFAGLLSEGG